MGMSQSTPNSNERQGRTPEKQEGGSEKRSDSTCSNKSVEHGHHIGPVGIVFREVDMPNGSTRIQMGLVLGKHCPVRPDGLPHYRSQQTRGNQPQPGGMG